MNFISVLYKMIELFLIIIIGFVSCKAGIFDKDSRMRVSKLVLNVTLPCTILASVMMQDNLPNVSQILMLMLVAMSSYIVFFVAALIVPWILRVKSSQIDIYRFMIVFGNVAFIGYPVTQAIFGDGAIFYTSVFNLPFNLLAYSVGVSFIKASAGKQTSGDKTAEDKILKKKKAGNVQKTGISFKTFLTPCMIASVIAIIMALCNYKGPLLIGETCDIIGSVTTPAALMIIGSSLADMPAKEMFGNVRVYIFALLNLIIVPLLTYFVFGMFVKEQLLLGVCVITAAMPVATNGIMLCLEYGGDEKLMAQGTFITTLASVITIPIMALLFI